MRPAEALPLAGIREDHGVPGGEEDRSPASAATPGATGAGSGELTLQSILDTIHDVFHRVDGHGA